MYAAVVTNVVVKDAFMSIFSDIQCFFVANSPFVFNIPEVAFQNTCEVLD